MKKFAKALLIGATMLAAVPAQAGIFITGLAFNGPFSYNNNGAGAATISTTATKALFQFVDSTASNLYNFPDTDPFGQSPLVTDFSLDGVWTASGGTTDWDQANASQLFSGKMVFTLSPAQAQQFGGNASLTNLLTITFDNAMLNATPKSGTTNPTFAATEGAQISDTMFQSVDFESDYFSFPSFGNGFSLAFSTTSSIVAPAVGEDFANFTGGASGTISAVPEPEQWGMLLIGFGLVGATMRRRREMSMVAA